LASQAGGLRGSNFICKKRKEKTVEKPEEKKKKQEKKRRFTRLELVGMRSRKDPHTRDMYKAFHGGRR